MNWIIVLPAGIIIGILFSSTFPEMASGINEALSPPIESAADALVSRVKEAALSVLTK